MKKTVSFFLVLVTFLTLLTSCFNEEPVKPVIDDPEQTQTQTQNATPTEAETKPTVPPEQQKKTIKFLAAGDILIHTAIYTEAKQKAAQLGKSGYTFDYIYENLSSFVKSADLAFVNNETPIAGNSVGIYGYPTFNSPTESGDALVDLGFDIVNMSNNHMLDIDGKTTGYKNTIDYWATKKVMQIGGYRNAEDYNTPRVVTCDGVTVAFLSYTYGTNPGTKLNSQTSEYIVPLINDSTIKNHIALAKESADLVFVSLHWGNENTFTPTSEQKRLAQLIADCGADVIIGHHSHTVQPVEWVTGKNGNKTLVTYSLGNLVSTMLDPYNMVGGIITFDIVKEPGKKAYIDNPLFNPTVCHYAADASKKDEQGYPTRTGIKVYLMQDYTEALCSQHGSHVCSSTGFDMQTLRNYAKNTVSSQFLPDFLK